MFSASSLRSLLVIFCLGLSALPANAQSYHKEYLSPSRGRTQTDSNTLDYAKDREEARSRQRALLREYMNHSRYSRKSIYTQDSSYTQGSSSMAAMSRSQKYPWRQACRDDLDPPKAVVCNTRPRFSDCSDMTSISYPSVRHKELRQIHKPVFNRCYDIGRSSKQLQD